MSRRFTILPALLLCVAAAMPVGANDDGASKPYQLDVQDDRVSLRASNALVTDVVRDMGMLLDFEVIADGTGEYRLSLEFEDLTTSEALLRICKPIGYVEVSDPVTGRVSRLVLTSAKGGGSNRADARREPLRQRQTPRVQPAGARPAPEQRPEPEEQPADKEEDEENPGP